MTCGHLTVICGGMFAGKTTELLKRILWARNGLSKTVLVVKPAFDDRYHATSVVSHDSLTVEAQAITSWKQVSHLATDAEMIFLDEAQFFDVPHFEGNIISVVSRLLRDDKDVIVACLDMDWRGRPFPVSAALAAMADTVLKLKANCTWCGQAATKTHKKEPNEEELELGDADLYEARCNTHWSYPAKTSIVKHHT